MTMKEMIGHILDHYGIEICEEDLKKIVNWITYRFSKMIPPRDDWSTWKEECQQIGVAAVTEAAASYNPDARARKIDSNPCQEQQEDLAGKKVPFKYWAYENLQRRFVENWQPDFTVKEVEIFEFEDNDAIQIMNILNIGTLCAVDNFDWIPVVISRERLKDLNEFLTNHYSWSNIVFVKRKSRKTIDIQLKKEGGRLCLKGECRRIVDCSQEISEDYSDMYYLPHHEEHAEIMMKERGLDAKEKYDLMKMLHLLPRQHRRVVINRDGLFDKVPKSAVEVATLIGYTPTTVHILYNEAITSLRAIRADMR